MSRWPRLAGVIILAAAMSADAAGRAQQANTPASKPAEPIRSIHGFDLFQKWSRMVQMHEPGLWDEQARATTALTKDELTSIRLDLNGIGGLLQLAQRSRKTVRYDGLEPRANGPARVIHREISLDQVPALISGASYRFGLNLESTVLMEALRELKIEVTRFAKLAAMMQADAVIFGSAQPGGLHVEGPTEVGGGGVLRIQDGQTAGFDTGQEHWYLARAALAIVKPDPAQDDFVRSWYRATSAFQGFKRKYGYLSPQLLDGIKLLPDDVELQFDAGVMHEILASPGVQVAIQGLVFGRGEFERTGQLKQAEKFLRRALEILPGMAASRLHLGRTLGQLERHEEAAVELRQVAAVTPGDELTYYAYLFVGAEEQALGRHAEARTAFERARGLFPLAQSPHLALSQLAWQNADRAAAAAAFRDLANLPADETSRNDLWWTYDISAFRSAPAAMEDLYARTRGVKKQ